MEHTAMGKMGPMTPPQADLAQERMPTRWNKTPLITPPQLTQRTTTLAKTPKSTESCVQCTATPSTEMTAGILTGALPMTQYGKPGMMRWWPTHTNYTCHPKER
jgi:hypothetical protein